MHVLNVETDLALQQGDEAKLRGLFIIFDSNSLGRISAQDFEKIVLTQRPANNLIERFKNKVKKGG